jgi:serine protease Do
MSAIALMCHRAVRRVVVPAAAVALAAVAAASVVQGHPSSDDFSELAASVTPAVVNVSVERAAGPLQADQRLGAPTPEGPPFDELFKRFLERGAPPFRRPVPDGHRRAAVGSGFLIDAEGHIVTNHHVIAGAGRIEVSLDGGESFAARLIGADKRTDLALLKIDAGRALPFVAFGVSSKVRPGDWVMTVGNPFGLGGTVTAGIVSARGRDLPGGTMVDFLQIDAPINRGNSGGPAFDAEGRVIGVNTAIFSPTGGSVGIGFAIPSDTAKKVIAELKENGRVERGWLGVTIQKMTSELARGLGLDKPNGVLIASVAPGGPAAKGGLRQGDVVTGWNGDGVDRPNALARRVAGTPAGTTARVTVWRAGATRELSIATGTVPRSLASADTEAVGTDGVPAKAGLALADIEPAARARFSISKDVSGALIVGVAPGSAAAEQGLRTGDVIRRVGNKAVSSVAQAIEAFDALHQERRAVAALLITRADGDRFVALDLRTA